MQMSHPITFKWEFAFGHVIQLGAGVIAVVAIYFTLINDVEDAKILAQDNRDSIKELREDFRDEALRREARFMQSLVEIKDDVRWLVREKSGDDSHNNIKFRAPEYPSVRPRDYPLTGDDRAQ